MAHPWPDPRSKESPFEGAVGTPRNMSGRAFVMEKADVNRALNWVTGTIPNKYTYCYYPRSVGEAQTR